MNSKLFISAISKFLLGVILVGLLVFLPAGTLNYINGIIFMCLLFIPMFIVGIILMVKNRELLKRRLKAKEKETTQSIVIKLSGLMFLVGFILAGLDYRYKWTYLPLPVSIVFGVIFILAYIMYGEVLRENTYLSRTIEVSEDQKVVDTGLYGVVRHPMYSSAILLFLSMPLLLGSLISFIIFLIFPFLMIIRIKNEEEVLTKELKGYEEYKKKVKYKLIPFIY